MGPPLRHVLRVLVGCDHVIVTVLLRLVTMNWNTAQDFPQPFTIGITDAELWEIVSAASTRHRPSPDSGHCDFCRQSWPCGANRLATPPPCPSNPSHN